MPALENGRIFSFRESSIGDFHLARSFFRSSASAGIFCGNLKVFFLLSFARIFFFCFLCANFCLSPSLPTVRPEF